MKKRSVTVRLTEEQYEALWAEHVETREPVAVLLVRRAFPTNDEAIPAIIDTISFNDLVTKHVMVSVRPVEPE